MRCLRSWLTQKYDGEKDFIFSLQDPKDPALTLLESLKNEFQFKIVVNPVKNGFSGKGSNLYYGFQETRFENIVFADSDIFINEQTLAKIMGQLQDNSTLVSCLPVHIEPNNIWSNIYTYIWNTPLVCLWGPSMISRNSIGAAGGVLAFKKKLLEKIGGVHSFAGYLAEDLIFGELVKQTGGKLTLGPKVFSPVERQSFNKFKNNLRRAHLIGLNFSKKSKSASFIGMFLGYSYTIFPLCALIFWNIQFLRFWGLFILTRFLFLIPFKLLSEKKIER